MDFGLLHKTAVVTGGGQGIGRAICLVLADEGANVAILDINGEKAQDTAQLVRDKGRKALAVTADVADFDHVAAAFAEITAKLGPTDVLVNCAAITDSFNKIENFTPEAFNRELGVNLVGPFYCIKQSAPGMKERGWGRIINISSRAGLDGGFGQSGYVASKGGLIAFTKTVALEYARYGVTANVVFPGLANTPAVAHLSAEHRERILRRNPTRRLREPEEIGYVVAFLASNQAGSINGAEINVTGGSELFVF